MTEVYLGRYDRFVFRSRFAIFRNRLPAQLQRKLDLPGRSALRCKPTRAGNRIPIYIEDGITRSNKGAEVWMIEYVENLDAKLRVEDTGISLDIVILKQGKIKIRYPGPNH